MQKMSENRFGLAWIVLIHPLALLRHFSAVCKSYHFVLHVFYIYIHDTYKLFQKWKRKGKKMSDSDLPIASVADDLVPCAKAAILFFSTHGIWADSLVVEQPIRARACSYLVDVDIIKQLIHSISSFRLEDSASLAISSCTTRFHGITVK